MKTKIKHIEFEDLLKLFRKELELKEVHTYKQHLNTCKECSTMQQAIEAFETIELIQPDVRKQESLFGRFSCGLKYVNAIAACFLLIFINSLNIATNTSKTNSTTYNVEQYSKGYIDLFNSDIDLGFYSHIYGLVFQRINIPRNAVITNANIHFTMDEVKSNTTKQVYSDGSIVCNSIIQSFDTITYKARDRIRFVSGFKVKQGATFSAKIESCN